MNNKTNIVIGVLILTIIVLIGYILFSEKKEQVSVIEKNMEVEVIGPKESAPYPYVLNKVYTYTVDGVEKQVTFLGYEKDPDFGMAGFPQFAMGDGGTAYFWGSFQVKLKNSGLLSQLEELNKKYGITFDGSLPQGFGSQDEIYNIKLQPSQNLFEIHKLYMESGYIERILPNFNNPGYGA